MQSGEAAVPAKENARKEPEGGNMELTPDQLKHILEKHISIKVKDDTLIVDVVNCCTDEDPCPCPIPKRVGFFSCHRQPCP